MFKKITILSLLFLFSVDAFAVCETERNQYDDAKSRFEKACAAAGIASIAGTILTLPFFGIGGLFGGGAGAAAAKRCDRRRIQRK